MIDNSVSISPASSLVSITASDATVYTPALRAVYVGGGGGVTVVDTAGNTVLFSNILSGTMLGPFQVAKVMSTGTSATSLVGFI